MQKENWRKWRAIFLNTHFLRDILIRVDRDEYGDLMYVTVHSFSKNNNTQVPLQN